MLDANENIKVAERNVGFEEARKLFYEGKVFGLIVIPARFERDIRRGVIADVAAYYDTSTLLYYRQLKTGVTYVSRTLGAGIQMRKFMAAGASREKAMASQDPLPYVGVPLFNPSGGYGGYIIPAVFILIIHQTLLIGIGMVMGARREVADMVNGKRLKIWEVPGIVIGRTAAYVSIGYFTALYNVGILHHYYSYPLRNFSSEFLIFITPFLIATTLFGLTLGFCFRHREVATALLGTSVPFLFIVGFAWPPEIMPTWLRLMSYAVPNTPGVDGFLKLTQLGAELKEIPFDYHLLWWQSAAYFVLACLTIWIKERVPGVPETAAEAESASPSASTAPEVEASAS
jgi:ABC-2 type transport system permease protein